MDKIKSYKLGKKGLLVLSLVLLLIPLICFGMAARDLEIIYPKIPGLPETMIPVTTKALLPKYLIYAFSFFLMISGIVVFGILIYAGFRYVTSAGDPGKMSDAKSQVFSAILGAVVLFSSFLLLNTINPQLIIPKAVRQPSTQGIIIFKDTEFCKGTTYACKEHEDCTEYEVRGVCKGGPYDGGGCYADVFCSLDGLYPDAVCIDRCVSIPCGGWESHPKETHPEDWTFPSSLYDELAAQNKAMWLKTPVSNLRDFLGTEYEQVISSIYFLESAKDLRILFYQKENWEPAGNFCGGDLGGKACETHEECPGDEKCISSVLELKSLGPGECAKVLGDNWWRAPRSIDLRPRPDGVHLCPNIYKLPAECEGPDAPDWCTEECPGKEKHLSQTQYLLDSDMIDNIEGLALKQSTALEEKGIFYGVVLHQTEGLGAVPGRAGACELFLKSDFDLKRGCTGLDCWKGADNEEGLVEGDMGYRTGVMSRANIEIASATVFQHLKEDTPGSVTFYDDWKYESDPLGPFTVRGIDHNKDVCPQENILCIKDVADVGIEDDTITSFEISDKYMAILFDRPNFEDRCQIFTESVPFLREHPLGSCDCIAGWSCGDCVGSFIILPAIKLGL